MKLYLLSQGVNTGYDSYESCVVCARNEKEAKTISPSPSINQWPSGHNSYGTWTDDVSKITAVEIGTAKRGMKKGVICSSFNAG